MVSTKKKLFVLLGFLLLESIASFGSGVSHEKVIEPPSSGIEMYKTEALSLNSMAPDDRRKWLHYNEVYYNLHTSIKSKLGYFLLGIYTRRPKLLERRGEKKLGIPRIGSNKIFPIKDGDLGVKNFDTSVRKSYHELDDGNGQASVQWTRSLECIKPFGPSPRSPENKANRKILDEVCEKQLLGESKSDDAVIRRQLENVADEDVRQAKRHMQGPGEPWYVISNSCDESADVESNSSGDNGYDTVLGSAILNTTKNIESEKMGEDNRKAFIGKAVNPNCQGESNKVWTYIDSSDEQSASKLFSKRVEDLDLNVTHQILPGSSILIPSNVRLPGSTEDSQALSNVDPFKESIISPAPYVRNGTLGGLSKEDIQALEDHKSSIIFPKDTSPNLAPADPQVLERVEDLGGSDNEAAFWAKKVNDSLVLEKSGKVDGESCENVQGLINYDVCNLPKSPKVGQVDLSKMSRDNEVVAYEDPSVSSQGVTAGNTLNYQPIMIYGFVPAYTPVNERDSSAYIANIRKKTRKGSDSVSTARSPGKNSNLDLLYKKSLGTSSNNKDSEVGSQYKKTIMEKALSSELFVRNGDYTELMLNEILDEIKRLKYKPTHDLRLRLEVAILYGHPIESIMLNNEKILDKMLCLTESDHGNLYLWLFVLFNSDSVRHYVSCGKTQYLAPNGNEFNMNPRFRLMQNRRMHSVLQSLIEAIQDDDTVGRISRVCYCIGTPALLDGNYNMIQSDLQEMADAYLHMVAIYGYQKEQARSFDMRIELYRRTQEIDRDEARGNSQNLGGALCGCMHDFLSCLWCKI